MIKSVLLTAVIAVAFAAPAFAFHCPKDMAAIDAALAKNPKLSAEQMAAVKKDRRRSAAQGRQACRVFGRAMQGGKGPRS